MINDMLMGIYMYMCIYICYVRHTHDVTISIILYYMQTYIVFMHTHVCAYVYVYVYCVTTYFVQPHFVCY